MLEDGFFHGLGHGVGLEVHELPIDGPDRARTSFPGDVVTIEPGLYRSGYGGLRLEDLVLVTEDGYEVITDYPYDLRAVTQHRSTRCSSRSVATRPTPSSRARRTRSPRSTSATSRSSGRRRAATRVTWFEPFSKLYEWEPPYAKWYLGGKLNVCFNCVDRHVEAGNGDKVAYYWEGEPEDERRTITFADLQRDVVRSRERAEGARRPARGRRSGSTWAWFPRLPVAMLACARLGAPHTVVFGGFSAGVAVRPPERHGVRAPDHAGRGLARRQEGAAEDERGRSRRATRRR